MKFQIDERDFGQGGKELEEGALILANRHLPIGQKEKSLYYLCLCGELR